MKENLGDEFISEIESNYIKVKFSFIFFCLGCYLIVMYIFKVDFYVLNYLRKIFYGNVIMFNF